MNKIKQIKNILDQIETHEHNYSIDWSSLEVNEDSLGAALIESQLAGDFELSSNSACAAAAQQGNILNKIMDFLGFELTEETKDKVINSLMDNWYFETEEDLNYAIHFVNDFKRSLSLDNHNWKPWALGGV